MSNIISMPVSGSHAVDRFKTNVKYAAKNALTVGATGAGMYLVAPKATTAVAGDLFNGIAKFKPEAKTLIGKTGQVFKNVASHSSTAWKALPSKAKMVFGAGLAVSGLLALNNNYDIGKIDGKHQTIKRVIQNTNGSGLYI